MRDVGRLGESTVQGWAADVGIAANPVSQDKTGWDTLLEFPLSQKDLRDSGLPLDREPAPLRCFVQVKSTDGQPGKRSVKLSNWNRFVKNPFPAFFLVLEFDGKSSCQRAFLVHVDETYIRKVLKALRQLPPEEHDKLHRHTLQLTYTSGNALPSLDGKGLVEALRSYITVTPEEYAKEKDRLVQTVGYEDGGQHLSLTILPPSEEQIDVREYLVDFSIGLLPHLDIRYGELRDIRFGIEVPEPIEVFKDGGRLDADRTPAGVGTIKVSTPDQRAELRFDAEVYLPQGLGFELEPEHYKIRFTFPFLNVVLQPNKPGNELFQFHIPDPQFEHTLGDIYKVAELIRFLNQASEFYSDVNFEIAFGENLRGGGTIGTKLPFDAELVRYITSITCAWRTAKQFDVQGSIKVKPAEFLRQHDQLALMDIAFSAGKVPSRISFWSRPDVLDDPKPFCTPMATSVIIGSYRMVIAFALIGDIKPTGHYKEDEHQYIIYTKEARVVRKHLYDRHERVLYSRQELIDAVIEEFKDTMHILLRDNINQ